jgi:ElaB/YqjD/DUF883 family membrane-anchored ribosome-binding protein
MQQIDTLHHTLTQAVSGFEQLFAEHQAPAEHDAADLQAVVQQLHELAQTFTQELGQKLAATVEALHQATAQTLAQMQQHATDWDQTDEALKSATTALEQALEAAAAGATSTLGNLQSGVEQAHASTTELLQHLTDSVTKVHGELVDTVSSTLKKSADEFHDGVASGLTGKLTEHLTSIFHNATQSLDNLGTTATHITQNFGHEAEAALQSFASGLEDGIKSQLEAAGEKLAKDAMEALATFVATSVAETTAGSAITTAMSPILPEVIVVKEASEAIKDLISVFKAVASVF